jgi:hypothetical protein
MKKNLVLVAPILAVLGACAQLGVGGPDDLRPSETVADAAALPAAAPVATSTLPAATAAEVAAVPADPVLTSAPPPPRSANTQAALDTTTATQRAQAAASGAPQGGARLIGSTVASLGSPTQPGFWLETPLVQTETKGRVTNKANGKSSAVTLIPIPGPVTGGSRLSLPAMRLIEASLTDLAQLDVTLEPS